MVEYIINNHLGKEANAVMSNEERKFILSCESTANYPYDYWEKRDVPVLEYTYLFGQEEFPDDMGRNPDALPEFYRRINNGEMPSTSQINVAQYEEFLEPLLKNGDVLHVAFGTGMTPAYHNAVVAAEKLREKYPERKLVVIDSLCSCAGYGMLTEYAADMRDAGKTMEETEKWLLENRNKMHHQFFSTDLKYFRRSGRMSGAAATVGAVLNICPLMHLDDKGRIVAYDKVQGKKRAINETVRAMARLADNGTAYSGKCCISHSNVPREAEELREKVIESFPNLNRDDIKIYDICPIIAAHCGPGTTAIYFLGSPRPPEKNS